MSVIVIQFITLDGRVTDPDSRGGTASGGWAFRHGPETVAGDKFQLGSIMDDGVMLLGRRTWELFAQLWPTRDDEFSRRMNAIDKLVVSNTRGDVSAWANSSIINDPLERITHETRDVIVPGSLSVVRTLMSHDLVDEYRLLLFPTVLGAGEHLFPSGEPPRYLQGGSVQASGAAILAQYRRADTSVTSAGPNRPRRRVG